LDVGGDGMGLYDIVKDAMNIAQKADNIELYKMLLEAQKETLDLVEENRELKFRLRELEEKERLEKSVVYKEDAYYIKNDDESLDGPFCRICWDKDRKLIRMSVGDYTYGEAACHVCNFVADKILKNNKIKP
jgi:hypothetical protein